MDSEQYIVGDSRDADRAGGLWYESGVLEAPQLSWIFSPHLANIS